MKSKILIVDDSRVSRTMIRGLVATLCPEWEIIEAATGDKAAALASSARPDFITMDINMPGMSGFDAGRLIQQFNPTIRIAVLTANIQESSREKRRSWPSSLCKHLPRRQPFSKRSTISVPHYDQVQ